MDRKPTVLFAPINVVGSVNASIGIGEVLKSSGHRVIFAVKSEWTAKLKVCGFEVEIVGDIGSTGTEGSAEQNVEKFKVMFGPKSRFEKLKIMYKSLVKQEFEEIKGNETFFEDIIKRTKPAVILIDHVFWLPSLMSCGIPWVLIMSCNPLCFQYAIDEDRLPPASLGLPTNGDPKEWQKLKQDLNEVISDGWTQFNDWIVSKGLPSLPKYKLTLPSPYLNVYMFPEELDYTDIRQLPPNFHRFDCFKRTGIEDVFEVPEQLKHRSGKLIYLSMGSMGSGDIDLMKRLVSMLSKSKHRFIVSKGVNQDKYELGDNMWGQKYLPQIKILPIIDLMITHGGNNTLTETLYFGKPFLVMPLFFDQFDNAQRVVEKGLGVELNPYNCTETQLLQTIDDLLNDVKLNQRLKEISKRIQSEENILKITKLIEDLIE